MRLRLLHIILFFLIFFNFASANPIDKNITLQLSWFNQFQFAGYYIAKEKGFYKEVGLNVNIKPFEFGIDIPNDVSNGKYDFAIGRETLILEKANNKKIIALYALFQASPLILISTKESKIKKVSDFDGKKIMTTLNDASEVSIKAMIASQKINIKDLTFIKHTHNIDDLIQNKIDIISAYASKSPYHLQQKGIPYNTFSPKDYGFDMYSDLLYTSEANVNNNQETVLKFKEASLKGWEYAYSNIEESVALILQKYNTLKLTKEELFFEAKVLKELSYYRTTTLGDIDLGKLQRIYDLYNVMGLVNHKIEIKDFILKENNFILFVKNVLKNLSKYIDLPYIYFFIILFYILIFLIIYKHIKLLEKEKSLLKLNNELKERSDKDYLTKLYNRRYFESIATEHIALAKRESANICILMIDIDKFKKVNDTYGHQVGDQVLSSISKLMTQSKRVSDVISRYGGEEFAVLLPNTSIDGAKIYSENLREKVESQNIEINALRVTISISIGLTLLKTDDTIFTAINRADEGLYESKKNGRNQITVK